MVCGIIGAREGELKRSVWEKTPTQLAENHGGGGVEATSLVAIFGVGGGAKVAQISSGQGARIEGKKESEGRVEEGKKRIKEIVELKVESDMLLRRGLEARVLLGNMVMRAPPTHAKNGSRAQMHSNWGIALLGDLIVRHDVKYEVMGVIPSHAKNGGKTPACASCRGIVDRMCVVGVGGA